MSKRDIIEALGLRRVTRYSDGKRVWVSVKGKEYDSLADAANEMRIQKAKESEE